MTRLYIAHEYAVDIPRHFGDYAFVKQIGSGSFSCVALAVHLQTAQQYAVKIISKRHLIEKGLIERFQSELTLMASLNHPNIVKFVEVLNDENLIYIITEFCPRGDLSTYLMTTGALGETQAKPFIKQILTAVAYIHSRGITHRDLKLENILLDAGLNVKIGDFGFAKEISGENLLSTQCGSPLFTAPEVISNRPYDGKSADMWSFGVIVYALVTGKIPWSDTGNQSRLFFDIQTARYHVPDECSRDFANFVGGLMHPQPVMRFTAQQALEHPWLSRRATMKALTASFSGLTSEKLGVPDVGKSMAVVAPRVITTPNGRFSSRALVRKRPPIMRRMVPETSRIMENSNC